MITAGQSLAGVSPTQSGAASRRMVLVLVLVVAPLLAASGVPANAYFLPDSGIFCLFADDEGKLEQPLEVTFTASDGSASSSQTIRITVVRPDAAAQIALNQVAMLIFE